MSKNNQSPRFMLFKMLAAMFIGSGKDEKTSNKRAYHQAFMGGGNGEFAPQKHPIMSYAKQNRNANKRRKLRAKQPK